VENDTNFTENSLTGCDHRVFTALFCDEAPPIMLGLEDGPYNKDNTGNSVVKMAMDSCYTTRKTAHVDEGGVRTATNHRTELVHTWILATNNPVHSIPKPLHSRFIVIDVVQRTKDYGDRTEKQAMAEDTRLDHLNDWALRYQQEAHQITLGVLYVNMLIRVGALKKVSMVAAAPLVKAFFERVRAIKKNEDGSRTKKQVERAISAAVTYNAVRRYIEFYGTPMGPPSLDNDITIFCPRYDREGRTVHPGIQPFLVASEAITVSVLSAFFEYMISYNYYVLEGVINRFIIINPDNCVSPDRAQMKQVVTAPDGSFEYASLDGWDASVVPNKLVSYLKGIGLVLSKHQVSTAIRDLEWAGVMEVDTSGNIKLWWDKVKTMFTFDETRNKYHYSMSLREHMDKIVEECAHRDFACNTRVLTMLPVDMNHQDILDEVRVRLPDRGQKTETYHCFFYNPEAPWEEVDLGDQEEYVPPEVKALRRVHPGATLEDARLYLYDYPPSYEGALTKAAAARTRGWSYPESLLEKAYRDLKATAGGKYDDVRAREFAKALLDRKRKRVPEEENPAEETAGKKIK
jgi:hypothetical protein